MLIHSVIQVVDGEPKCLHCSTDADAASAAVEKSAGGLVTWYRMGNHGGDVFKRVDHEATAAQQNKVPRKRATKKTAKK